jgi:hypothetical protein
MCSPSGKRSSLLKMMDGCDRCPELLVGFPRINRTFLAGSKRETVKPAI